MKRYYWSIEYNAIVSAEELENDRQKTAPDQTLEEFITNCSYQDNGDPEPLSMEIERQRKYLLSTDELYIADVKAFITELEELEQETVGAE